MASLAETISVERNVQEKIIRFDIHQIIQHAVLMISFIALVVTGLPMKFHEAAVSQWWVGVLGGIETVRSVHHFFAWLMVLVCLYHAGYLFYTIVILERPFPSKMLPGQQDFITYYQEIKYFLGISKERPQYDRFNWREKFDYWALFWGMPIMIGSGFILMYPVFATKYLPGWFVPAALIAHSDEAMLALIWIFMVHIFFNHFAPGVFPLNTSIFTGRVSKKRYRQDHPLEYERLVKTTEEPRQRGASEVSALVESTDGEREE